MYTYIIYNIKCALLVSSEDFVGACHIITVVRLSKAMQVHNNLYLLTVSSLLGLNELTVISLLQDRSVVLYI